MKFGGASLSNPENIKKGAEIIKGRKDLGKDVVVVASAMGDMTNNLIKMAKDISKRPPLRELDMLVTAGERISIALLAMALLEIGVDAISFTGSQSGIITTSDHFGADIVDIRPERVLSNLNLGKVVIVAGFQGVSREREITSLGRGGSDTSAVAIAKSLNSSVVEFYKDVDGVYSKDPKLYDGKKYERLEYGDALMLAEDGGAFLHPRAIKLARDGKVALHMLSYKDPEGLGTKIGD